jgi:hypothetical protein
MLNVKPEIKTLAFERKRRGQHLYFRIIITESKILVSKGDYISGKVQNHTLPFNYHVLHNLVFNLRRKNYKNMI